MTICFLSFLFTTSTNGQNTIPAGPPNLIGGNVGIGILGPVQLLDVLGGNINVQPSAGSFSYMFDGIPFLWNNGVPTTTIVGFGAGVANTGMFNTFVGNNAGAANTTSNSNTFVGSLVGIANTIGFDNAFFGTLAGWSNTGCGGPLPGGNFNSFFGMGSGKSNQCGSENTFVGHFAGTLSRVNNNTFVGANSGAATNNGGDNTFMGEESGQNVTSGNGNTIVGRIAGNGLTTGIHNTFIGHQSGFTNPIIGSYNAFLGVATDASKDVNYATAIGHHAIVTNSYNIILGADSTLTGLGLSGVAAGPQAKLDVENDATNYNPLPTPTTFASNIGGKFITSGTNALAGGSYYGVYAQSFVTNADFNNIGGSFSAWNCQVNNNIGVTGNADDIVGGFNIGGQFQARGATTVGGTNIGVKAEVKGGASNFGVYSIVTPSTLISYPVATDIAIYGNCGPTILPGLTTKFAGYFDGAIWANGIATWPANAIVSDQLFKIDVDTVPHALDLIRQFKPKTYFMDTLNQYGFNFTSKRNYGFIAQDVEQILPELVFHLHKPAMADSLGNIVTQGVDYKALNYNGFIPILTRGIQKQSNTIDSLKAKTTKQDSINTYLQDEINQLTQLINNCCTSNQNHAPIPTNNKDDGIDGNKTNSGTLINVKLTDAQNIILDQNVPNPFNETTTIGYNLPDNTGKAQLLFYNAGGKLIQSVELTNKGQGSVNVFAQDLSNGMYTYTLVVDGKIMETKKMIKQ